MLFRSLFLILLLLVFGKVRVYLDYFGTLSITYTILGVEFVYLQPKKQAKAPELFDLTDCKNPEKAIQKHLKQQKKELAKLQKKQKRADLKWAKKRIKKILHRQDFFDRDFSFEEILTFVWDLLKKTYHFTKGKLRLNIRSLKIDVGSSDPATTALLYGGISATLAGLLDFLDANWIPTKAEKGSIEIKPDFLADASTGEVRLTVTVSLLRVLMILLRGEVAQEKELALAEAHKAEHTAKQANPASLADDTNTVPQKG